MIYGGGNIPRYHDFGGLLAFSIELAVQGLIRAAVEPQIPVEAVLGYHDPGDEGFHHTFGHILSFVTVGVLLQRILEDGQLLGVVHHFLGLAFSGQLFNFLRELLYLGFQLGALHAEHLPAEIALSTHFDIGIHLLVEPCQLRLLCFQQGLGIFFFLGVTDVGFQNGICKGQHLFLFRQILKDYAVGRLLVPGDIRYLSGDLLALLYYIANKNAALAFEEPPSRTQVLADEFAKNSFYAPGAVYEKEDSCTLLRNPHIARNEEIQLSIYPQDELRDYYFGHLTDVVMVDAKMLAAERLGGADYDGDLVRTIADPILNACVRRNYEFAQHGLLSNNVNLPLLNIPSMASPKQNPDDWYARFVTVKNTFSARIGQICNAALDRSVIAYNEKTDPKLRKQYKEETEVLAILSGLEIDAAKTGIRPDLSDYLGRKIQRTPFLKYKTLVEEAEERREWYEDTHREKLNKFFTATDWEKVDSPVERLPLLARQLQKGTKKPMTRKAKDEELFLFAQEENWQTKLNPRTLHRVGALMEDYEDCLRRIRSCRAPVKERKRKTDIERILYRRGQEDVYDPDELYALFQTVDPEHLTMLRSAIREENWHLMKEAQREAFLLRWLPGEEFEEWYDLLTDFRYYGFRVLGDVVGDIDDANTGSDRKQLHRVGDSEAFAAMMQAYIDHPRAKYYRDAVARECRNLLKDIVNLNQAVRYIVSLGKRDLLWELVPELIEKNVLEVKENA